MNKSQDKSKATLFTNKLLSSTALCIVVQHVLTTTTYMFNSTAVVSNSVKLTFSWKGCISLSECLLSFFVSVFSIFFSVAYGLSPTITFLLPFLT